jgi:hypothetical protein
MLVIRIVFGADGISLFPVKVESQIELLSREDYYLTFLFGAAAGAFLVR